MLIAARYLVDRMRQPRSRADELLALRRRLQRQPVPGQVPQEEEHAALELARLRQELAQAIGPVRSCHGCARGHPLPHGRWDGGHCCGACTEDLFNDDEVAALRLSGTTPGRLAAPLGEQAGCAFRGPTGCSLAAPDRPNICVRYVCPDLARELHERGDLARVEALGGEMEAAYLRFAALRAARLGDEEIFGPAAA